MSRAASFGIVMLLALTAAVPAGERHLFVDDAEVESSRGVERVVHPATKRDKPVIVPDKPWERRATYLYGTVLFDDQEKVFKAWYQTFWMDPPVAYICYATSRDGVTWEKPSLGLVECEGSKANNIVLAAECGTVVMDLADTDPARRFKMLAFRRPHYDVFFSADGITWRPGKQDAIREGDVANVTYDPRGKRFVAMTKQPHKPGRAVFVSYSDDFETWTKPKLVFEADASDQAEATSRGSNKMEVYGMPAVDYHGVRLGFPWMFRITGKGGKNTGGDGFIDIGLATSRDWEAWQRPSRTPILANGVAGSVDFGMIMTASSLIERGDELRLYYGAWDGPHGTFNRRATIGLATWPRDRIVSLSSRGAEGGEIVTLPVRAGAAGEPIVNANFSAPGASLVVEVVGENIRSKPFTRDELDGRIEWPPGAVEKIRDRDVRLRFVLTGGDLYSFSWR